MDPSKCNLQSYHNLATSNIGFHFKTTATNKSLKLKKYQIQLTKQIKALCYTVALLESTERYCHWI